MIPGPGIIPADGWWFIARSADGGHLMLICMYQIDQMLHLELALVLPEEEGMMQQSSVSISLSF